MGSETAYPRRVNVTRTLIAVLTLGIGLTGCGGGSTDLPAPAAQDLKEGNGMNLISDVFENESTIPTKYTCDGDDVSPPLGLSDIPAGAESLALVVEDPDAPAGTWDHWVAYDIPVMNEIPEGVDSLGTPGQNSWGRPGYGGPCPPSGTHRYVFTVYALDARLDIESGADKPAVLKALDGHVLATATLMGRYSR